MFSYHATEIDPSQHDKLFALIDCSIDEGVSKRISGWLNPANQLNLFKGTFAAEAERLSPVLTELAGSHSDREELLEKLLPVCEGKPLLSFIAANTSLNQLAEHLKQLLTIRTTDGQEFFLRYADNRVLPAIFTVLTDAQQRTFLGPIQQWLVATHRAEVIVLSPPPSEHESIDFPLQLDDAQFAALLERSELHFIVAQLEQANEPFAQSHPLAARIEFVERNIDKARQYGFKDADDQLAWCLGALRGGEQFFLHEFISPILERTLKSRQKLFDALMFIPQEDWQSIENGQFSS